MFAGGLQNLQHMVRNSLIFMLDGSPGYSHIAVDLLVYRLLVLNCLVCIGDWAAVRLFREVRRSTQRSKTRETSQQAGFITVIIQL
jgi:hypothetical protein